MNATVLKPGDAGYDEARKVWNGRFDARPARIVLAAEPAHVVNAIADARAGCLEIGVRSGGHDYAGNSAGDGGLLIDLSRINGVSIDADRRRAKAGAGARWRDFDAASQASGLATTGATVSTVGVAGFTLGGGEGWLTRKHGLACDNLVSAEVVTAGGEIVHASEDENADLFWALRGGGGNFGIVTGFEFALHPLDHPVLAGQVIYPFERAAELLRFYRDRFASASDEAACFPFVYRVPPLDVFPQEWHGKLVLAFVLAWLGDVAEGEAWMAPFRSQGNVILDGIAPVDYLALQQSFDAGMASGSRWYTRAHSFDTLPDAAIDAFTGAIGSLPGEFTTAYLGARRWRRRQACGRCDGVPPPALRAVAARVLGLGRSRA